MPYPFELSETKKDLLKANGHLLCLGGPGAGKTTVALIKAKEIITHGLKAGQEVLFLSFARATVARVEQQSSLLIDPSIRKHLEIETYHGFTWSLLKSHGYLLNGGVPLRLLPPPEAASRLADIQPEERQAEMQRLFEHEGLVHFDLFAGLSAELLDRSHSLRQLFSKAYPAIILDEFQDTNLAEWLFIQQLGRDSTLIALADAEQRIYEFRGADPARINDFINTFQPRSFDLAMENNRSSGTDIVQFGNDILSGANRRKKYSNVIVKKYTPRQGNAAHLDLKSEVFSAMNRVRRNPDWSLGVLVPTKKLMLTVSDYLASRQTFSSGQFLPALLHEVSLEMAGPSLSAVLIARLMEKGQGVTQTQQRLLIDIHEHIRGRNGTDGPSKAHLALANSLKDYLSTGQIRGSNRRLVVSEASRIAEESRSLQFTGDPVHDWILIRNILHTSTSETIRQIAIDAQYLRLLRKGTILSAGLSNLWRSQGAYRGASGLVRGALLQEHFSASAQVWKGINVMTIHKAKGKEFNEVIIYEGVHQSRIAWRDAEARDLQQSKLALRVGVTRAMQRTTILTPAADPCFLL